MAVKTREDSKLITALRPPRCSPIPTFHIYAPLVALTPVFYYENFRWTLNESFALETCEAMTAKTLFFCKKVKVLPTDPALSYQNFIACSVKVCLISLMIFSGNFRSLLSFVTQFILPEYVIKYSNCCQVGLLSTSSLRFR